MYKALTASLLQHSEVGAGIATGSPPLPLQMQPKRAVGHDLWQGLGSPKRV